MNQPLAFDLALARQLANYSARAYRPATGDRIIDNVTTDTGYLIADYGDAIVLAFRGTRNLRDWITDAEFFKVSLGISADRPDEKVHGGFYRALDSILSNLIGNLLSPDAFKAPLKPLIITGHSLGGALASLAAFILARRGFIIRAVYTFASPRVGNAAWRAAYNALCGDRTFRVACVGDLVPLIPGILTPVRDGYRHVGTEVFLDGGHIMVAPNHYLELLLDGCRAYHAIKAGDIEFIVQFHSIEDDYIASLASAAMISL